MKKDLVFILVIVVLAILATVIFFIRPRIVEVPIPSPEHTSHTVPGVVIESTSVMITPPTDSLIAEIKRLWKLLANKPKPIIVIPPDSGEADSTHLVVVEVSKVGKVIGSDSNVFCTVVDTTYYPSGKSVFVWDNTKGNKILTEFNKLKMDSKKLKYYGGMGVNFKREFAGLIGVDYKRVGIWGVTTFKDAYVGFKISF